MWNLWFYEKKLFYECASFYFFFIQYKTSLKNIAFMSNTSRIFLVTWFSSFWMLLPNQPVKHHDAILNFRMENLKKKINKKQRKHVKDF